NPRRNKAAALANNLEILRLCKQYEVPVILGSDAHISFDIANYSFIWPLLAETEFPDALIMNYDTGRFLKYIG
ncbi:MAG: phosphatase, partial [Bacteroidaceae bacterium]|nr:phosphatase [Bacteroidaceae bacterium]